MPAHIERFVSAAWTRGADVIILDLEDSVPEGMKARARARIRTAIAVVGQGGAQIGVRINSDTWHDDIEASIWPGLQQIIFPKAEDPASIRCACELVDQLEVERGLKPGSIGVAASIETVPGLYNVSDIFRAHSRVQSVSGPAEVDFTVDLGLTAEASIDQLEWARGELDLFMRSVGLDGAPRWTAGVDITNLEGADFLRGVSTCRRRDGMHGASGVHPATVEPSNMGYTPAEEEIDEAQSVVSRVLRAFRADREGMVFNNRWISAASLAGASRYLRFSSACKDLDAYKADCVDSMRARAVPDTGTPRYLSGEQK